MPASSRSGASGVPRQRAVPTASSSQGWLTTCGSTWARPLPAHSIVTASSVEGRSRRSASESESGRSTSPSTVEAPGALVHVGDVVVGEEVVEPDRGHVPAQSLEREPVVARSELQLLVTDPRADPLAHGTTLLRRASYVPRTFTARAVTRTTMTRERTDSTPMSAFARSVIGIASVGLNAVAVESDV